MLGLPHLPSPGKDSNGISKLTLIHLIIYLISGLEIPLLSLSPGAMSPFSRSERSVVTSGPIRGQYPGHVISLDQSEPSDAEINMVREILGRSDNEFLINFRMTFKWLSNFFFAREIKKKTKYTRLHLTYKKAI